MHTVLPARVRLHGFTAVAHHQIEHLRQVTFCCKHERRSAGNRIAVRSIRIRRKLKQHFDCASEPVDAMPTHMIVDHGADKLRD